MFLWHRPADKHTVMFLSYVDSLTEDAILE